MQVWWGKGKQAGSFVPVMDHKEKHHQIFAVYTYGVVEIYFQWYSGKTTFDSEEKRIELLNRLNQIRRINLPTSSINKRPSIKLSVLSTEPEITQFLSTFDWVLDEIHSS